LTVLFGFEGELKKKQINNLRQASCSYIKEKLKDELDKKFQEAGINGYSLFIQESQDTTKGLDNIIKRIEDDC
jgi:L-rhamnose mutarotase